MNGLLSGVIKLRIVHISDTHMKHHSLIPNIPSGDILIHSGDFFESREPQVFSDCLKEMDLFFRGLPHRYKLFVAGNHEICFKGKSKQEIQAGLPNVKYLEDDTVVIHGVKIYGTPWNKDRGSLANAYVASDDVLQQYWEKIPCDTDILVTHNPPHLIHDNHGSMGCKILLYHITNRIRPRAHLFGHTHRPGITVQGGILYSNAACYYSSTPHIFDVIFDLSKEPKIRVTEANGI